MNVGGVRIKSIIKANHSCDELRHIPAVAIILQAFIPEEQRE